MTVKIGSPSLMQVSAGRVWKNHSVQSLKNHLFIIALCMAPPEGPALVDFPGSPQYQAHEKNILILRIYNHEKENMYMHPDLLIQPPPPPLGNLVWGVAPYYYKMQNFELNWPHQI